MQILFGVTDTVESAIARHRQLLQDFFLLIIDIPLATLKDQKTDHIQFLKKKISELKLQMCSEVPGNLQNFHPICNILYTLYNYIRIFFVSYI